MRATGWIPTMRLGGSRSVRFCNYKEFIKTWIKEQPNSGHGQLIKIAAHLNVHTSLLSLILRGGRHFTLEQGLLLCEFLGISGAQMDYFLGMIQSEKAGTPKLKEYWQAKLRLLKESELSVAHKIEYDKTLSELEKAQYYSSWHYAAIRLLTSLVGKHSAPSIARKINLPVDTVSKVLQFLVQVGLCQTTESGHFIMGPARLHLNPDSPWLKNQQSQMRFKAVERLGKAALEPHEVAYSALVSLSLNEQVSIRQKINELILDFTKKVQEAPAQKLALLNIDWIDF